MAASTTRILLAAALFISTTTAAIPTKTAAHAVEALATYAPPDYVLFRRDECPGNTFQCDSSLGEVFSDICCQDGQTCAFDGNNNPACCPSGAVCTGTAPATAPPADATGAVSFVSNQYFSFPYAPATFDDRGACTSAVKACSRNYDSCVTDIQGDDSGGYPVTIAVPGGGGTTVDGTAANLDASSATSICSSLSSEACSDLEATSCDSYDNGAGRAGLPGSLTAMFIAGSIAAAVLRVYP